MEVALMAATSLDGFIAREDGRTDWVKDDALFEQTSREFGCIVMGQHTFAEFGKAPFKNVKTIILSTKNNRSNPKDVHYVSSVDGAIKKAKALGCKRLLVVGGSKTNESFAAANVLTRLLIDIHPIELKAGKKIFGDFTGKLKLKLIGGQEHPEGFTHMEYKVSK